MNASNAVGGNYDIDGPDFSFNCSDLKTWAKDPHADVDMYQNHACHSPTVDAALGSVVTIVGAWTLIANIIVILAFRTASTKFAPLFIHLACSDILAGCFLSYFGVYLVLERHYPNGNNVSEMICCVLGWLFNVMSIVTPLLITQLGIVRCISVYKVVWFKNNVRKSHVNKVAVFWWVYSALAVSSLAFKGSKIEYIPRRAFCDYTSYGTYNEQTAQILICTFLAIPTLLCTLISLCTIPLLTYKIEKAGGSRTTAASSRAKMRAIILNIAFTVIFVLSFSFVIFIYIGTVFVKGYVSVLIQQLTSDTVVQTYIQMCYYYITCLCSTINPIVLFILNSTVRNWLRENCCSTKNPNINNTLATSYCPNGEANGEANGDQTFNINDTPTRTEALITRSRKHTDYLISSLKKQTRRPLSYFRDTSEQDPVQAVPFSETESSTPHRVRKGSYSTTV